MDLTPFKNCYAHTKSIFINTNGDTRSCCYLGVNLPSKLNFQEHKRLLEKVDIAKACNHCIQIENSGTQWSARKFFTKDRDYVISVFFDSLCNQSCVSCFPTVSSSLALEWHKSGMLEKNEFQRIRNIATHGDRKLELIKEIVSSKPNENISIEVYGGEPTSSPHLVPMVEWLVENNYSKNIQLLLISNGSQVLKDLEKHLSNFRSIKVSFSIDGVNDTFTYLRWPTSFQKLQDNIDYYYTTSKQNSNLILSFNYTLSWMNILNFFDFINWMYGRYDNLDGHMVKLVETNYFSVDVLSDQTRNKMLEKAKIVKNNKNEKIINFYIDYLSGRIANADPNKMEKALAHMKKLDAIRQTNCTELFKDIIDLELKSWT